MPRAPREEDDAGRPPRYPRPPAPRRRRSRSPRARLAPRSAPRSPAPDLRRPFVAAARRQPKSCDGEISSERASAEIFTPGSSDAATARSLKSSDHRRRSPTGAPSSRSARTSMNWFGLVLRIGVDIDLAIHVDRYHPRTPRRQNGAGYALTMKASQEANSVSTAAQTSHPCQVRIVARSKRFSVTLQHIISNGATWSD